MVGDVIVVVGGFGFGVVPGLRPVTDGGKFGDGSGCVAAGMDPFLWLFVLIPKPTVPVDLLLVFA